MGQRTLKGDNPSSQMEGTDKLDADNIWIAYE